MYVIGHLYYLELTEKLPLHADARTWLFNQYDSKLKELADDNSKFDENGRKLSKRVENTVWKGEIARYEQFLLFPVFSKDFYCRHVKNQGLFGKGLKERRPSRQRFLLYRQNLFCPKSGKTVSKILWLPTLDVNVPLLTHYQTTKF